MALNSRGTGLIYLDHHSTTPVDPEALAEMLPFFQVQFANAGSITHEAGRQVAALVEAAIAQLANLIGAASDEVVITSGATESNNLALLGSCLHPRQKRRKIVSVETEHKAVLDPLERLKKQGFEVELLPVLSNASDAPGCVDPRRWQDAIDDDTALVSVMLANNEVGTLQPMRELAIHCRRHGVLLHTDASQAVGRVPVDVDELDVDLLSFSAHKFYGPKGVGGLFVRRRERRVKLQPQIVGGGQQHNLRSGTMNTAAIIGMAAALRVCVQNMAADSHRIARLRNRLFEQLRNKIDFLSLNGPPLQSSEPAPIKQISTETVTTERALIESGTDQPDAVTRLLRLPGNLNCSFFPIEGQSLMLAAPELAVSSGSACTSAEPMPSHVLLALGLTEEHARSSLRFGIGRFNTLEEIDAAASMLSEAAGQLLKLLQ